MNSKKEKRLMEFHEFLNDEQISVPHDLKKRTYENVLKLLKPNAVYVFSKISVIHFFVGLFSLSICHQFEFNPFHTHKSLSDVLLDLFGHEGCALGGGAFFLGLSFIISGLLLNVEEIKSLRAAATSHIVLLSVVSIVFFKLFGGNIAFGLTLMIWFLGAFIGGRIGTELIYRWRVSAIS